MRSGELYPDSRLIRDDYIIEGLDQFKTTNPLLPLMGGVGSPVRVDNGVNKAVGTKYVKEIESELQVKVVHPLDGGVLGTGTPDFTFTQDMMIDRIAFEYPVAKYWAMLIRGRGTSFEDQEKASKHVSWKLTRALNRTVYPQLLYDCLQSLRGTYGDWNDDPTVTMNLVTPTDLSRDTLLSIFDIARLGFGFPNDPERRIRQITPIGGVKTDYASEVSYYFLADAEVMRYIKKDPSFSQTATVDVRGNHNMLIRDAINGAFHNIVFIELPTYSGTHQETTPFKKNETEIITDAGLRSYDTINGVWSGHPQFRYGNTRTHRCMLVGADALIFDKAGTPTIEVELGEYKQSARTALFQDLGLKKAVWSAETEDYAGHKFAGSDNMITVDITI